jgi:hypothetical protein
VHSVFFVAESLDKEDIEAIYKVLRDRNIRLRPLTGGKLISVKEEE